MTTITPITPDAPGTIRRPVFGQAWTDLTYVHWPVDPAAVRPLLPAGTEPDECPGHEGVTWVGLIAFHLRGVSILGTPPLPLVSSFLETNVRLYTTDAAGRRGVVFRSLDADQLLPVLAARASYRLPYMWSSMRLDRRRPDRSAGPSTDPGPDPDGDEVTYTTRRRWPGPRGAASRLRVRVGPVLEHPDEIDHFLTARWGLHTTWWGGATVWAPVAHERWPLHRAELLDLDDDLVVAGGLPPPVGAPRVLYSPGVTVRIGRPVRVRRRD